MWIGLILETCAAASVCFTSKEEFFEALETPECVASFEYFQSGRWTQLERSVAVPMKFGNQNSQFSAGNRDWQAL